MWTAVVQQPQLLNISTSSLSLFFSLKEKVCQCPGESVDFNSQHTVYGVELIGYSN